MLREYYRLRDRAQLPKIRFHDLRHSAATILKLAGFPDEAIQKLLGHASVRTTQHIYLHLTPDAEKSAARKMDEIFRAGSCQKRENSPELNRNGLIYGAPGEIRTPDLLVRSQTGFPKPLIIQQIFSH
jgi:hypothetical protein